MEFAAHGSLAVGNTTPIEDDSGAPAQGAIISPTSKL